MLVPAAQDAIESPEDQTKNDAKHCNTNNVRNGCAEAEFLRVEETVRVSVDHRATNHGVEGPRDRDDQRGEHRPDSEDAMRAHE